jgi:iron complex transport system substrate-binding protein
MRAGNEEQKQSFLQVGEFAIHRIAPGLTEVRDGAGRTLLLIPRDAEAPEGYSPDQIVRVPVKSVVAYG